MQSPADGLNTASKSTTARRRAAVGASVGTLIEYYDYYLYGLAAATVFPKVFFPGHDATVAQLASFASFAFGFLLRPIGGVIFGHIGDRAGRKAALMITVIGMGLATAAIGLIPAADKWGTLAPILLILCRSLQGLFVGGEMGGAATLIVEHAKPGKRGILTSGVHGDEMSSIHTVQTVMSQLDPAQMSGTVMAVTDVSRPALESMQRRWTNQGRGIDLIDMNR